VNFVSKSSLKGFTITLMALSISDRSFRKEEFTMKSKTSFSKRRPTHDQKFSESKFEPYLNIWESVLQFIAWLAALWRYLETGGELYGLLSHAGRPTIMFATGPGKKAIHTNTEFRQDIDFLKQNNIMLGKEYGIQYLGNWHSHGRNSLDKPSHRDIQSNRSTAVRNNYKRLCQFVLTRENQPSRDFVLWGDQSREQKAAEKSNFMKSTLDEDLRGLEGIVPKTACSQAHFEPIRINAFFYMNALLDDPRRCPLRVIPGVSPISQALNLNPETVGIRQPLNFPISRLLYDSLEISNESNDCNNQLPKPISDQCLRLPPDALNNLSWVAKDEVFILSIPLPDGQSTGYVAYDNEFPHKVKAAYLGRNSGSDPIDLTSEILSDEGITKLHIIYLKLKWVIDREKLVEVPKAKSRFFRNKIIPVRGQILINETNERRIIMFNSTDSRLQIEKAIVASQMPQFVFSDLGNEASFQGWQKTTTGNEYFYLKLEIPPWYPDKMPNLFVTSPHILKDRGGKPINTMGSVHSFHTLSNGAGGCVRICHFTSESWDASKTCVGVLIKGILWLEAYSVHLITGITIAEILDQWKRGQEWELNIKGLVKLLSTWPKERKPVKRSYMIETPSQFDLNQMPLGLNQIPQIRIIQSP